MKITFAASLPDILSAISLSGVSDSGARIKLDVPASDVGAVVLLQQKGAGKLLKVTIEVVEGKPTMTYQGDADLIAEAIADSM
jgi:hypothetical protein